MIGLLAVSLTTSLLVGATIPAVSAGVSGAGPPAGDPGIPFLNGHLATFEDVEGMKARFGFSALDSPGPAMVDGFGTGLIPPTEEQWLDRIGEVMVYSVGEVSEDLPPSFDLSSDPAFPAVGNQQAQGSCAAWAATYYSYGYLEALDREWTGPSSGDETQLLSPAWTYNMVNSGMDRGSWMDTNMMVIRDWGVSTMATMPYDQDDVTSWGSPEAFREAPLHRALEVGYIEYSPGLTVEAVKALVASGTPVAFAMDAGQYSSGFSDGNYIISSAEYSSYSLNHAQTIVGFDDSLSDDSDTGAFRVVNSWGASWGDSGYYWFTYAALEELGDIGQLVLNFIADAEDYEPSLLAVWHFDDAPYRNAGLTAGVGVPAAPSAEKTPYYESPFNTKLRFPTFMCLDMTEHESAFWSSPEGMYLSVGDSRTDGTLSSFRMESYQTPFEPGRASWLSGQSLDVPSATPCTVGNILEPYALMDAEDALDMTPLTWTSTGQASWVPVDHHSSGDGDSMQTGDVSDGGASTLEVEVEGPCLMSFDWKVSSQAGKDFLRFSVDGEPVDMISGNVDWMTLTVSVPDGSHTLAWTYQKDSSVSSLEDCGWVDSLVVTEGAPEPPRVSLDDSYEVVMGEPITVQPSSLENPSDAELTAWYDWGDSSEWTSVTEESSYAATHTYQTPGVFSLRVFVTDGLGNNVTDGSQVTVHEQDRLPSFVAVAVEPDGIVLPGTTVTFELVVSDHEGGSLTVVASFGDGSPDEQSSASVSPDGSVTIQFLHEYAEGSDYSYEAAFEVRDEAEHYSTGWASETAQVTVNSPPEAVLVVSVPEGAVGVPVGFDASESSDAESAASLLSFRWDWDGDGTWDTGWSASSTGSYVYDQPGTYEVTVEVMDAVGLTSSASTSVTVSGEAIPEFSALVVPVAGVLLLFLVVRSRRKG